MDADALVADLADRARRAARTLRTSSGVEREAALLAIADEIIQNAENILSANAQDIERAHAEGMSSQLLDRLLLTPERIMGMVNGARQVANLPDPLGITLRESTRPNGLHLRQMTVPFGVVGPGNDFVWLLARHCGQFRTL